MQQMIDEDGNLWTIGADGAPVFAGRAPSQAPAQQSGPAPFTVGRPSQTQPYEAPKAAADLQGTNLINQQRQQELVDAQRGKLPTGYRWGANGQAELIPGVPGPAPTAAQVARDGELKRSAVIQKLMADVRGLYQRDIKGGWPNGISGNVPSLLRPQNEEFNAAANGILPLIRPLVAQTAKEGDSDKEMEVFMAYIPRATDNDNTIERKLNMLEALIGGMANGSPPSQVDRLVREGRQPVIGGATPPSAIGVGGGNGGGTGGPPVLPQAAGAHADPGLGPLGATAEGGLRFEQGLAGIPNAVAQMIGQGATSSEVTAFLNEQYAPYGGRVGPDMAAAIGGIIQRHRANPRAPIKSLGEGWDNFSMLPANQESSMLGRAADTSVGNTFMHGANAATFGLPTYMAGDQGAAVMDATRQSRPGSSMLGEIGGGTAAMLATGGMGNAAAQSGNAALRLGGRALTRSGGIGGDMLYGATRGGLEDGPEGVVTGALAAGAGNKIGGGVADLGGRAVRGVSSPAVRYLADKNIPMTLGQMLGNRGMIGRTMNKLESVPVLGDALQKRRMEGIDAFNREAFKQAVDPINGPLPGMGSEGIDAAQQAVGQAYDNAYGGINLTPDQQFAQQAGAAVQSGRGVPVMGEQFDYIMRNQIEPLGSQGVLDGPRLQAALQALKGARADFAKEGAMGRLAGDAVSGVEGAFNDMVARQAPGALPQINAANAANRNVSVLEDAVLAATNQGEAFTPAQLRRAAVGNTKKFGGKKAAARGQTPFNELTGYAQDVLPSTIPNSGTADRGLSAALLPAALGGGALGAQQLGEPKIAVPLGVLAAITSKNGSKAAQKLLTGRSNAVRAIGVAIRKQKRRAGLFGAATGVSMLPNSSQ